MKFDKIGLYRFGFYFLLFLVNSKTYTLCLCLGGVILYFVNSKLVMEVKFASSWPCYVEINDFDG